MRKPFLQAAMAIPFLVAACENSPQGPANRSFRGPEFNLAHTTLTATKTAEGYWTRGVTYDWTLVKSVTPPNVEIGKGSTVTLDYTLTATRNETGVVEASGVRGQVCVTNNGISATDGLQIYDELQRLEGSTWKPIVRIDVDVSAKPVLQPGETFCYPYNFPMSSIPGGLQPGVTYRNEAGPSILNWDGTNTTDRDFRIEVHATFTVPAAPTTDATDESATLADVLVCPVGFTCSPGSGPWLLTGSQVINYAIQVTNISAPCSHTDVVENAATLTEGDTGNNHGDSETVVVTTPRCDEPPSDGFQGCTPGYWKQTQHFGSWVGYIPTGSTASRYNDVFGVNLFSSSTTLLQALSTGGGGLARFGRHSTAALLNAASGSVDYGMTAAQVIAAVQNAVATGNFDAASDDFERRNERQCPLGRDD